MKKFSIFILIVYSLLITFCAQKTPSIRLYGERELTGSAGWQYLEKNKPQKAISFFNKLDNPYLKNTGLAYSYLEMKSYEKSEKLFKEALKHREGYSALAGLAQLKEIEKKFEEAFYYYRKALQTSEEENPYIKSKMDYLKGVITQNLLKKLEKEESPKKRADLIEDILFVSPEMNKLREELIRYYFSEGNYKKVVEHYDELLNYKDKPSKEIRAIYAKSLYKSEMYTSALLEMEELYKDYPDDLEFERLYYDWKAKIESLKIDKYIKSVREKKTITREELAAILYSKFSNMIDSLTLNPKIILDIQSSWAKEFIKKIVFAGIMKVELNHNFNLQKEVSRLEMAEILYRFLKKVRIKIKGKRVKIADVPSYHFKRKYINFVVSNGLMVLDKDKKFYPQRKVSGKELSAILEKLSILLRDKH